MTKISPNWKRTKKLGKIQEAGQTQTVYIPKIHGKLHHSLTYKNKRKRTNLENSEREMTLYL